MDIRNSRRRSRLLLLLENPQAGQANNSATRYHALVMAFEKGDEDKEKLCTRTAI
jgi:hypothetical protein